MFLAVLDKDGKIRLEEEIVAHDEPIDDKECTKRKGKEPACTKKECTKCGKYTAPVFHVTEEDAVQARSRGLAYCMTEGESLYTGALPYKEWKKEEDARIAKEAKEAKK